MRSRFGHEHAGVHIHNGSWYNKWNGTRTYTRVSIKLFTYLYTLFVSIWI